MIKLRYYQEEAVDKICSFFSSNKFKAKVCISHGLGKTIIIANVLKSILEKKFDKNIAFLTLGRGECNQIINELNKIVVTLDIASCTHELIGQRILITTYQDILSNQSELMKFDLVICDEAYRIKDDSDLKALISKNTKFLGLLEDIEQIKNWFGDAECIYSYTMKDSLKDGYNSYIAEKDFIERFLIKLLDYQGYRDVLREVKITGKHAIDNRVDIVAKKEKGVIIEVKVYRNLHVSYTILNNALKQMLYYKMIMLNNNDKNTSFILVMPCEIDDVKQKEIYKKHNIIIWDINNLIYMCQGNKELLDLLISCIPYPLFEIRATKPVDMSNEMHENILDEQKIHYTEMFQNKLENCESGKTDNVDKKYEKICSEIIKYLFNTEFYKIKEQHKTGDEMFRMDLLCSLKGTSEFWKFLITFYHTKFIVFEYKNYSSKISQNMIYITEKYLFPVALRNVAFIISRKGFDNNAKMAALGCLKESGKLIISLEDNDLIEMVKMKENGEEPSDYLLDKVENILMSVSK